MIKKKSILAVCIQRRPIGQRISLKISNSSDTKNHSGESFAIKSNEYEHEPRTATATESLVRFAFQPIVGYYVSTTDKTFDRAHASARQGKRKSSIAPI